MKLRALAVALAISGGAALLAPGTAEARHRHDRYCHHGRRGAVVYYESAPRYRYYDRCYDCEPRYYRSYRHYDRYDPYYDSYRAPRYHYHNGRRCSRVHVGLFLGF